MSIAYEAMIFAMEAHKDQRRKYTGNPYTDHLAEVAGIAVCADNYNERIVNIYLDEIVIATAWLHDCVEDCDVSIRQISNKFGIDVAYGVDCLSDIEKGNRKLRKELSRKRLSKSENWVQNIKVADLISNTSSIVQHDPKFAKVYLEEKRLLLDVLTKADERLIKIARKQCEVF